jgi:hypothetical protein
MEGISYFILYVLEYNHSASLTQNYYKTLLPNVTYIVDVWMRHEGLVTPQVTFGLSTFYNLRIAAFNVTGNWTRFQGSFRVSSIYRSGGGIGTMGLTITGPGQVRFIYRTYGM